MVFSKSLREHSSHQRLKEILYYVNYCIATYTNIRGNIIKDNDELQWTNEHTS